MAATRSPPAVAARRPTLKRDTSTVLDGAHVHGFASNLVCTQVLTYGTGPAQKKGASQRSLRSQPRFCPTLVPSRFLCHKKSGPSDYSRIVVLEREARPVSRLTRRSVECIKVALLAHGTRTRPH